MGEGRVCVFGTCLHISPNRAKNGVCVLNNVQKPKPKRAKIYEKGTFGPKIPVFGATVFSRSLGTPSPLNRNWFAKQLSDSFEIIQKIGSHLEKFGQF